MSSTNNARQDLQQWLFTQALPTWFAHGIDWAHGGFHERLNERAQPLDEPRRTRVVARQIYVFCAAQRLGWTGRAQDAIRHGLAFLLNRLRQPDGLFASSVNVQGEVIDSRFDLYEQAFALFALAHAHAMCPDLRSDLRRHADNTLDALYARYKHPAMGFEEAAPPSLPLKANPHMHLLEAALAWQTQADDGDEGGINGSRWRALADELAELALRKLINPGSGALYECFDADWSPLPGAQGLIVEPGHQFEWGWLLMRWGRLRQHADALQAARRLIELGREQGICPQRQVAINQLDEHFHPIDTQARLWPQTEWVKAYHALRQGADSVDMARARAALQSFLQHPYPGLWHEVMNGDGSFALQPCRASSLYHIVCAIDTLHSS